MAGSSTATMAKHVFRIRPFIARRWTVLADEFDAERFAVAPDHFAGAPGAGVARERQPQLGRQHVVVLDRDPGPRRGNVLDHAGPRGKPAVKRDPPGLAQRFARFPFPG